MWNDQRWAAEYESICREAHVELGSVWWGAHQNAEGKLGGYIKERQHFIFLFKYFFINTYMGVLKLKLKVREILAINVYLEIKIEHYTFKCITYAFASFSYCSSETMCLSENLLLSSWEALCPERGCSAWVLYREGVQSQPASDQLLGTKAHPACSPRWISRKQCLLCHRGSGRWLSI